MTSPWEPSAEDIVEAKELQEQVEAEEAYYRRESRRRLLSPEGPQT